MLSCRPRCLACAPEPGSSPMAVWAFCRPRSRGGSWIASRIVRRPSKNWRPGAIEGVRRRVAFETLRAGPPPCRQALWRHPGGDPRPGDGASHDAAGSFNPLFSISSDGQIASPSVTNCVSWPTGINRWDFYLLGIIFEIRIGSKWHINCYANTTLQLGVERNLILPGNPDRLLKLTTPPLKLS